MRDGSRGWILKFSSRLGCGNGMGESLGGFLGGGREDEGEMLGRWNWGV